MSEELLKVKLVVDSSDLKKSAKQAQKDIGDIAKGSDAVTNSMDATNASMEELADTMKMIKGLEVFELMKQNSESLKGSIKDFKNHWSNLKDEIGGVGTQTKISFQDLRDGIESVDGGVLDNFKDNLAAIGYGVEESCNDAIRSVKALRTVMLNFINTTAGKLAILVGMFAGVGALAKNGLGTSALAKQTAVLAQQAGMSVQVYQKWAYILGQCGLEVSDMIGAQQTLLEAQMDVRDGAEEMVAAFERIGLSQDAVLGMNQQQLYEAVVEGLQGVENATERAHIAQILLSEDAKNLAPLFNMTAQEVAVLTNNFNTLNGAMSQNLIQSSLRLQSAVGNLSAAWQGLKNTLAEAVLPFIITVANALAKVIAIINLFTRTIFGFEIGGGSEVDSATAGIGGYSAAVDEATGAVQKLKRATMGFDELNIVQNPNSASGGGSGASGGGGGASFGAGGGESLFNPEAMDLGGLESLVEQYKTQIQDIATFGLIAVGVGLAVYGALTANIPLVLAGLALAGIGFFAGSAEGGTWDRLAKEFAARNLEIIPIAMIGVGAGLAVYGALTANIPMVLVGLALAGVGLAIANSGDGWGATISKYTSNVNLMVAAALTAIGFLGMVVCLASGNIPGAVAFGVIAGIGLAGLGTDGTFYDDCMSSIQTKIDTVKKWFEENILPLFTKEYWQEKWNNIKTAASEKLEEVKKTVEGVWSRISSWYNKSIAPKFTKEYWQKKFETIKQGAKAAFNGLIGVVESAINSIIKKLNTVKITVPNWVPVYGGKKFGFTMKQISIPRLATGGIVQTSTIANIGEAGKEAVLPLENNTQWMDILAERIASRNQTPSKIVLKVGERELGWATINGINQITKQTGELQLQL